jgi:hypothetical protein
MKLLILSLASALSLLILAPSTAIAEGCYNVHCELDGQYMQQEECYFNGIHKSCKFGHTYYGANGPVHHYVMVSCN